MNESLKYAGVSILGAGIGLFAGYKFAERKLSLEFENRLEDETGKMREFYETVKKPYDTPEEAAAALIEKADVTAEGVEDSRVKKQKTAYNKIVANQEYASPEDALKEFSKTDVVHKNVFENERDPNLPYVISQDEFMQSEDGYEQETVTYYAGSDKPVLADEKDDAIEDPTRLLGEGFEEKFGQDSSDENTVHIRNPSIKVEYEVVRHEGSFFREVMGLDTD